MTGSIKCGSPKITAAYKPAWDNISIFIAALCMVHCIALPLLLTTLPLWGFEVLENPWIELATVITAFLAGGWAIYRGYRRFHKRLSIVVLFFAGLSLLTVANFLHGEVMEMLLKGAGAVLVIIAHVLNWRRCRPCSMDNPVG